LQIDQQLVQGEGAADVQDEADDALRGDAAESTWVRASEK